MRNAFFVSALLCLLLSCSDKKDFFENATCISNVNVIDVENGLRENMTVIIKDDRILNIEKSEDLRLSEKNKIIDASEKYIIPGLWDAHVHFAYIESLAPSMFKLFLTHGITSVRDTGGKIDFVKKWRSEADKMPTEAPRVKIAGPLLDGLPNVYDGSAPSRPALSVGVTSVEEAEKVVDELDRAGVDLIKAYEMLSPEQFKAVTARANEKGLKVTGHVPLSMDVISASNAGLNSMEHLRNLELSTATNADELLTERRRILEEGKNLAGGVLRTKIHELQRTPAYDSQDDVKIENILATLEKNDTWQIPTLALNTGSTRRYFLRSDWAESFDLLPADIQKNWSDAIETFADQALTSASIKRTDWSFDMIDKINKAGIPIMAGTDCPIFFLTPGLSLHEELVVLVQAGLTNMEAIESATLNPAIYFGLQDELGLVKKGFIADLLLLDANPLENIQNTNKINAVIKNGKVHSRKDLDQMLMELKNQ
jgi:imidazolonepropionase-like amidohydrolase